jgi:hypothetical protein
MVERTRPTPAAWRLIPEARGGRQDCQMQRHERFSKFGKSPARADPRSHQLDRGPGRVPGVPRVPGRRAGVREGLLYPHADGGPARGGPARRRYREHLLVAGPVRQRASRTLLARSGGPGLRWSRRGSSPPCPRSGQRSSPACVLASVPLARCQSRAYSSWRSSKVRDRTYGKGSSECPRHTREHLRQRGKPCPFGRMEDVRRSGGKRRRQR